MLSFPKAFGSSYCNTSASPSIKKKIIKNYSIATTKRQTHKTKFNHWHSACFPAWAPCLIMNSFICDLFYDKHAQCSECNGARVCRVVNALLSDWKEAKRDGIAPTSNGSLGMLGELMLQANPGKIAKKKSKETKMALLQWDFKAENRLNNHD